MAVIVAILAPDKETYTSLQKKAHKLAKDADIEAEYERPQSIDALRELLKRQGQVNARLCLCCDVSDSTGYTAEDIHEYLTEVWRDQADWLHKRPLIVMSGSDQILKKLQVVAKKHQRAHSSVVSKIEATGTNRWKNIRDALQEGIIYA